MLRNLGLAWLALLFWTRVAHAFYLPGVSPTDYDVGDRVPLLVNSLTPAYYAQSKTLRAFSI